VSKLPLLSARECIQALEKAGFYVLHQSGSHIILRRDDPKTTLSVPNHREIRRGTLRAIIRQSGMTVEEFMDML
jgi:predicted RNA binding protein YcfA (HicA-like mRNA interferase family)